MPLAGAKKSAASSSSSSVRPKAARPKTAGTVTSSSGYSYNWRTKDERMAEQRAANASPRDLGTGPLSDADFSFVSTGGRPGASAGEREVLSAAPVSIEDKLICALKEKVSSLEAQNLKLSADNSQLQKDKKGAEEAGGGGASSWTPAHCEKLVMGLHNAETKNSQLEEQLTTTQAKLASTERKVSDLETELKDIRATAEKRTNEFKSTREKLEKELLTQSEKITKVNTENSTAQANIKKLEATVANLTADLSDANKRAAEAAIDAEFQNQQRERSEAHLNETVILKDTRISELESHVAQLEKVMVERDKALQILDSYKKAVLMPKSEAMISKQLDELRREHSQILLSLQQKCSDLSHVNDKAARLEQVIKNQAAESASLRAELNTKSEFAGLLQQKNQILENEAMERKQLSREVDTLKAEKTIERQKVVKLESLNDELAVRLHSVYEQIPPDAVDAWIEPHRRAKLEAETSMESYRQDLLKAQKESGNLAIEVSHLQSRLTVASEAEQRLQKKVVEQTMQIEQLTRIK